MHGDRQENNKSGKYQPNGFSNFVIKIVSSKNLWNVTRRTLRYTPGFLNSTGLESKYSRGVVAPPHKCSCLQLIINTV
jgi:hypothetical protein